jgi:hypothetical protein
MVFYLHHKPKKRVQMKENSNRKRVFSKSELANLYNSDVAQSTAERILRRWIHQDADLMKALQEKNYNKHCHILTPVQVDLIFSYLGEP